MSITAFSEKDITQKSPATITGQLEKLRSRRLIIGDESLARRTLETVNYYRLVHYLAVFLEENGQYYSEGTRFEDGVRLYDFDRKLRAEVLSALEEIEIAARAAVSNYHAVKYGALGYLNADSFDRRHNHKVFLNKIEGIIDKNSHLTFVRHHNVKYGGAFPLWVMSEMFSFGMLVVFFGDMKSHDKKDIAEYYFKQDSRYVENWLENLAALRNRCAHYNRIYGNPLPGSLRTLPLSRPREHAIGSTLFDYMLVVKLLHSRGDSWGKGFAALMQALFYEYSSVADCEVLGFPPDWEDFFVGEV